MREFCPGRPAGEGSLPDLPAGQVCLWRDNTTVKMQEAGE